MSHYFLNGVDEGWLLRCAVQGGKGRESTLPFYNTDMKANRN